MKKLESEPISFNNINEIIGCATVTNPFLKEGDISGSQWWRV